MAKRFTDSNKFNDSWYRRLSPLHKVIWEYLLSECNHAGILKDLDLELMSFKIGNTISQEDLELFKKDNRVIFLSETVLYIPKFITFQYGDLNQQNRAHASVIKELKKWKIKAPFMPLNNSLQGVKDKEKEKDKYKDMDKDINIDINNENFKKIKDPYINPIKTFFISEYNKIFGNKPMLSSFECNRLVELAADNSNIKELIPVALEKLKNIDFEDINYTPSANWLLRNNNFERVINGEFDKKSKNDINNGWNIGIPEYEEREKTWTL